MKKAILILLMMQLTVSAFASRRVTVDQLNRVVDASHGKRDAKVAERLYDLELTERLSAAKLAAFEAALPGPKSRRALVAVADLATFLNPPPAEIPNLPTPSIEQQREMAAKAVEYVKTTLKRLPNLFARRDTIRFEDTPAEQRPGGFEAPSGIFVPYQPLHPISRSTRTVAYRDGQEIDETTGKEQNTLASGANGLTTIGEFGPILSAVFSDLPQGNLAWGNWEQGTARPVAVFRFKVPRSASHYEVKFCCVSGRVFQHFSAYHGEVTIDPANGTILRLTLLTDLNKADPIIKADLMVEYGPIELGKQTFFCPVRSISVTVAPVQWNRQRALPGGITVPTLSGDVHREEQDAYASDAPLQTMLNEVVFDEYHLFYSQARIVTAENSEPASNQGATTNAASASEASSAVVSVEQAAPAQSIPPSAASTNGKVARMNGATSAALENVEPGSGAAPSAAPSSPEISVVTSAPLPQTSAAPAAASVEPSFSMRVSTRLVDVGVTAYDKKGRPVTDLTREDFVISDNGKKQSIRSFTQTNAPSASPLNSGAAAPPALYSNRIDAVGSAQSAGISAPETSTIVFLDATSLSFAALSHVRQQILKFFDELPPSEPVGLYVRAGYGFRVLAEATTNHAALSSALLGWMPNAQDVARAQEEDMRNRQQFDTVQSASDMQYVNGNIGGTAVISSVVDIPGGGAGTTTDPKLMKEGSDPTRQALTVVVAVAAHLGAIPGHKNLVWAASQNVLADWSDQAVGSDKGSNRVGSFIMRTEEALNDAHVSLYPLVCSQLETAATDASLQNASVQLDPSADALSQNAPLGNATPLAGGRAMAEMRQNLHPVHSAIQQMAQATGGRSFNQSDNVAASLKSATEDGNAIYLLTFAPDTQPDDRYHALTVSVPTRRGITLRYRTGYLYSKEPSTLRDRFKQVIWQPLDATEIAISARRVSASAGAAIALDISASDVALAQHGNRWKGKLDIFLVQRDVTGMRAEVREQTLVLDLTPGTYQKVKRDGIPFDQYIDNKQDSGTARIIVVDESSGRIGSITLPASTDSENH